MHPLNLSTISIRPACADDHQRVITLAVLDSAPVPEGPLLLGEVDGELRAALALREGAVIADPFFPTLNLIALLRSHARALEASPADRRRALGAGWRLRRGAVRPA